LASIPARTPPARSTSRGSRSRLMKGRQRTCNAECKMLKKTRCRTMQT
jgi:hypothetical protein